MPVVSVAEGLGLALLGENHDLCSRLKGGEVSWRWGRTGGSAAFRRSKTRAKITAQKSCRAVESLSHVAGEWVLRCARSAISRAPRECVASIVSGGKSETKSPIDRATAKSRWTSIGELGAEPFGRRIVPPQTPSSADRGGWVPPRGEESQEFNERRLVRGCLGYLRLLDSKMPYRLTGSQSIPRATRVASARRRASEVENRSPILLGH